VLLLVLAMLVSMKRHNTSIVSGGAAAAYKRRGDGFCDNEGGAAGLLRGEKRSATNFK